MSIRCAARTCGRPPTTTLSTCCCGRCAASTARRSSRSTACRRSITGVDRNGGGILTGLLSGGHRASGPGPDSHLDLRHPHRAGGIGRPGADAAEGGRHSFLRAFLGQPGARSYQEAYAKQVWTAHHWQHWLARGRFPYHRWRSHLTRSALTLKALIFAPTGAIAAAATTSLPETPGGERNWDYRFTWIRDATFALWGLYTLGFEWEANDYFAFLCDLVERDQGDLQIVYGVDGRRDLEEHVLEHLSGYQGARPVRIGNAAYPQNLHDVWGVVLDSVYLHTKSRDRLDERVWKLARQQVERALERWRGPDQYGSRHSLADQGGLCVAGESGTVVEPAGACLVPSAPVDPVVFVSGRAGDGGGFGDQVPDLRDGERDHAGIGGRRLVRRDRSGCLGVGAVAEQGGGDGADREGGHHQDGVPGDRGIQPDLGLVQPSSE